MTLRRSSERRSADSSAGLRAILLESECGDNDVSIINIEPGYASAFRCKPDAIMVPDRIQYIHIEHFKWKDNGLKLMAIFDIVIVPNI